MQVDRAYLDALMQELNFILWGTQATLQLGQKCPLALSQFRCLKLATGKGWAGPNRLLS